MQGSTALIQAAASKGHTEVVKILVNAGADVNSKDNKVSAADGAVFVSVMLIWLFAVQGKTALDHARKYKRTQIIQLLMK